MRKLLIAALCVAVMGLAACNQDKGKPRVAVVDADKVLSECQAGKKGMDALRAMSEEISAKLKTMEAEMGENGDKSQEKMQAFQQALGQARNEINREQMRLMGLLQKGFDEAVEEYRAKNGLDVILLREQALAVAPEADASKAIIAALDAKNIDLSKPVEAAPAAPAAPEAPAAPADKPAEGKAQ